ncbi:aladin isoform X2 [Carassius gibelio]|uniref:aladin isoform X1 n=1 Tax=Carassius gibelio TaxID=101364 RepID=UPI002279DAE0|nr:aladin isoform X1 [Carassius gibelio]XP_052420570.1 aladin isoform X2 [Carassius gibelio]
MCSLGVFPAPVTAAQTLFERNNELLSALDPGEHSQVCDLPSPQFTRDTLKGHSRPESSSRSAFLDQRDTLWMRSAGAWRDVGLYGLLDEITNSADEVPRFLAVGSSCVLALLRWASSFHGSLFPHLTLSSDEMVAEFSQMLDWSDSALRSFAWHPHTDKFAVALLDDSIKIYKSNSSPTPTLKHRCQRSVCALQWKPLCGSALAVACQSCLLIWHVDPASLSTRPSSGCAQVLSHPGHSPITSIAWSPTGSLLVSASPVDTSMMVWDVAAESTVPLQRVGGGGVTHLSWSPDGSRLLAATPSALFRVWETRMWTCERWPCLKGSCQSACWSPDGGCLLLSMQGERVIYALTFSDLTGGPKAASVVADLSETTFPGPDGDLTVGGEVCSLSWDPRGERLAVLLKGDSQAVNHPSVIAVFKTRSSPVFELLPCGFVMGESGAEPRFMQFHPHFQHGALLTVCWSDGRISHVPFYFSSAGLLGGDSPLQAFASNTADPSSNKLYTEQTS